MELYKGKYKFDDTFIGSSALDPSYITYSGVNDDYTISSGLQNGELVYWIGQKSGVHRDETYNYVSNTIFEIVRDGNITSFYNSLTTTPQTIISNGEWTVKAKIESGFVVTFSAYKGDTLIINETLILQGFSNWVIITAKDENNHFGAAYAQFQTNGYTNVQPLKSFSGVLNANNIEPPSYVWTSFEGLNGNSGNYQLDLSKIADEAIGDGTPEVTTNDASIFTLPAQAKLRRIGANLQEGVEQTVLWCGDNYATATRRTVEGVGTNIVYLTFKFYYRSEVLAFTSPELVSHYEGGDVVSPETYLGIIYDDEMQVAAVDAITYNPATDTYKYNLATLPAEQQLQQLWVWLQDNGEYHEQGNPYDTGSEDNGGEPGTPRPQDSIGDSPLPTISGLNMGIVTLYHPDDTEVAAISQFLWSDNVLDNFKKYFNNFADNILSLYVLPFTPDSLPTKTFKVGNMTSEITGVEYVTSRYYDIDMGSVEVLPRWDSYLDYSPYTKIEIYLPYLGSHSLDVDEIMSPTKQDGTLPTGQGSRLKLTYRLDILTGVIVAKIFINNELRYQFEGKCGASLPLTGQTYASMVQGIVQAGAGLATTIATGGLTAPLSAAAAVAGTVNATKPSIERVGNISGEASMLCSKIPYITISSPSKPYLDEQEKYTGYPSYKAATLGSFSGFTQVVEAHVEGISCTEEERTLILKWLKEGVII